MTLRERVSAVLSAAPLGLGAYLQHVLDTYLLEEHARESRDGAVQGPLAEEGVSLVIREQGGRISLEGYFEALARGDRRPDELIFLHTTRRHTPAEIQAAARETAQGEVEVLDCRDLPPGRARNRGIQRARHAVVVLSESDCLPGTDWLAGLVKPLLADQELAFVTGRLQIEGLRGGQHRAWEAYPLRSDGRTLADLWRYAKNIAFRKTAWARAGGFPEYVTPPGEVVLFAMRLWEQPLTYRDMASPSLRWEGLDAEAAFPRAFFRQVRGLAQVGLLPPSFKRSLGFGGALVLGAAAALGALALGPYPLLAAGLVLVCPGVIVLWGRSISSRGAGSGFSRLEDWWWLGLLAGIHSAGYLLGVRHREDARQALSGQHRKNLRRILEEHPHRAGVVVYFPTHDWGYMFQRPQQIAREFARRGYLYFFCTKNEVADAVAGFQPVEENLILASVPLETFQEIDDPILYIGSPWFAPLLDWYPEARVIYDCYDDLEVSSARQPDYRRLTSEADLVLASSTELVEMVRERREQVLYVPNAVDYVWVQSQQPGPGEPPPADMAACWAGKGPVIGYIGILAKWFDYPLLAEVAASGPDWQFVLIGGDYDRSLEETDLLEMENVSWLGWKPYSELFSYVWHFDVAVIPFRVNHITRATSPVKLFEYFACRKPVVATPLPECLRYNEVLVGEDPQAFRAAIQRALKLADDPDYLSAIDGIARQNTWEARVQTILEALTA